MIAWAVMDRKGIKVAVQKDYDEDYHLAEWFLIFKSREKALHYGEPNKVFKINIEKVEGEK